MLNHPFGLEKLQTTFTKIEMITISVIIPTYNRALLVQRAINSVLSQTHQPLEIIVVDDGSTDQTAEVLKLYGEQIKYIYQQNEGVSSARNRGIRESQGTHIAFLDSDDEWLPQKLEHQESFLERNSSNVLITDSVEQSGEKAGKTSFEKCLFSDDLKNNGVLQDFSSMLLHQNFINLSTVIVKKECFNKEGFFDENLIATEDTDLWMRFSVHWPFGVLNQVTVNRFVEGDNLSADRIRQYWGRLTIFAKLLRNEKACKKIGKEIIKDQLRLTEGRYFFECITHKKFSGILNLFFSRSPAFLLSSTFYKGIHWSYKSNKVNG